MKNAWIIIALTLAGAPLGACIADPTAAPPPGGDDGSDTTVVPPESGPTSGDGSNTFDHDNNTISPWNLVNRLEIEGPPSFTSHMHSCPKIHYATLGHVLTSLGVNAANKTALTAGELYTDGSSALASPNFANRIRESLAVTTSGASREFDIFAAAAPEIIANVGTLARCKVGSGAAPALFDASNACQAEGISCLLGVPATQTHVDLCNLAVAQGSTPDLGKRIAVASLLAAAYTCE